MHRVNVIIPNWNGESLLPVCLESLGKQRYKDFEVIVVDNNSSDKSLEILKKFNFVRVVNLDKNYGFAKAVNEGIRVSEAEYLVLLNNDTKVDKDWLFYLVKEADERSEVGMVASKMLNFYNPEIVDSAGDYIDAVGHADNIGRGKIDSEVFNKEGYVFLVNAGAGLFKKEVFNKVGLFDEDYFAYFEDVDLSFRAQLHGIKGWYCAKAICYHVHKATSSKNKSFTEYLQFRNMTQTMIKDFPLYILIKDLNWMKIILVNLNTIRYLAGIGYLRSAVSAEVYIILNLPRLLMKRWEIQKNRKVSNQYIYKNIQPKKITFFGLLKKGI